MKTIFKGNPFSIVWNIIDRSTNHPFEFTGMKVEVGLYSDSFNFPLQSYNVNNGTITAGIEANTLPAGVFNIMCRYSTDHEQSYCTYRNAFQISVRPCHASEIVEIESHASHIDPSSEDPDAPDYSKCQLIAEELFGVKLHLPELTANRAIADEHGNRIPDTYVTRSAVAEHIRQIYNQQFLENPPLITEGYITPEMLSEETRQMLEATGQEITNLPDGEDLNTVHGVLKFANKEYNPGAYSGMGRVYLRKNIVAGRNVLTQSMISKPNTIYIIQYDYDLQGAEITVPEGCVLDFQGGSLNDGTINGNITIIKSLPVEIFNSNITLTGSWNVADAFPEWFGAKGDGVTDDSDAFNRLFRANLFSNYSFKNTTYIIGSTIFIEGIAERNIKRVINGNGAILKPGRNLDIMFKVGLNDLALNNTYPGIIDFNSFSIWNNGYTVEKIFHITATNFNLRNISIQGDSNRKYFNTAIWLQRDWYGSVIEQCTIHFCNKAVVLAGQVNLLHIYKSAILACDYGVYTDDNTYPVMVSHEADDLWIDNCDFEGNTHSIYHNDKLCQITSWKITNNHFEGNKDIEIYIPTKIDSTIFNFHGGVISNNLFLGFKGIIIGTESGGEVFGVLLANNVINGDTSKTVLIRGGYTRNCLEYGNRCSIGITITIYDTFNSNGKPSGSVMVRYENQPILPWGTMDTKGVNGDIRWNEKGIFIKNNLWRFIPTYDFGSSSDIKNSGERSERPTGVNAGFQYFDITLNKPIWWTGSKWVDATGAEV